jgi:hypothetical protein
MRYYIDLQETSEGWEKTRRGLYKSNKLWQRVSVSHQAQRAERCRTAQLCTVCKWQSVSVERGEHWHAGHWFLMGQLKAAAWQALCKATVPWQRSQPLPRAEQGYGPWMSYDNGRSSAHGETKCHFDLHTALCLPPLNFFLLNWEVDWIDSLLDWIDALRHLHRKCVHFISSSQIRLSIF